MQPGGQKIILVVIVLICGTLVLFSHLSGLVSVCLLVAEAAAVTVAERRAVYTDCAHR